MDTGAFAKIRDKGYKSFFKFLLTWNMLAQMGFLHSSIPK